MDARVGILMRNGKQVYYGFIGGVFDGLIEKNTPEEVVAALDSKVAAPAPKKTRVPSARTIHVYIVKITVKYPSCDDFGTEIEVLAYNAKDAITSARKQIYNYYDRFDGTKTYSARRRN